MKNIQFNYSKYWSKSRDLDLFETIIQSDGTPLIQQKQLKEIVPRLDYFDFEPEIGDIYLMWVGTWLTEYYECEAPKDWPDKYANYKIEPGIYHIEITNIYKGHVFYKIKEIEKCLEMVMNIRNGFPSIWYFDKKDLPESKIEYMDLYETVNWI